MLDWTGERFVPWAKEAAVAYEHLHRYIWASSFVEGKRVLDLASGEGYGADILSRRGSFVCGVDIDSHAIDHASAKYRRTNLEFLKGSLTAVPIDEHHSFDIITSFEAIEHIQQHDDMMREVKRLLKPDGLFIVSVPNKETYNAVGAPNPFHVRELAFEEFNTLLTRYFPTVSYFGQHVHSVSSMWPLKGASSQRIQEFDVERRNGEFRSVDSDKRPALYFVAIASELARNDYQGSILLDCSDQFIRDKDEALAWRAKQVQELVKLNDDLRMQMSSVENELKRRGEELDQIRASRVWKFLSRVRALREKLGGK